MNYPYRLAIYPNILKDGQYQDGFEIYIDPEEIGEAERHEAKNAEELLVFLMGVYNWHPEGYGKEAWQVYVEKTIDFLGGEKK